MSTMYVDNLREKTLNSGIHIPGHIVQVLNQEITAYTTTNSASSVATGFTLTITPKSATSIIRCTVGFNGFYVNATAACASITLYKNGSFHKYLDAVSGYAHASSAYHHTSNPTLMVTDSPNTTSPTTYAIFWRRNLGSGNVYMNNYATANGETRSYFTVEEIAQ